MGQIVGAERLKQNVYMVRHYAPSEQLVTRPVEMFQATGNDLSDCRPGK